MRVPMRVVDLIRRTRDGRELSREEIEFLIGGFTRGDIPDYQMSAWAMAVVLRGLTRAETAALTETMLHSGRVLDLSGLPAVKVDKHSTGGVGDKTSLVIAPIAAAAGVYVPMISGRGLGHSGGTLDKLESIPGFNVNLTLAEFRRVLEKTGCAMIGQTEEIAPADKKLYALRDVTGTVESPELICASIMSKKLAEGIDALVLDVKTGSGAFMKKEEDAVALAELLLETGQRMGKRVVALITDMEQPLGHNVGNALEVAECLELMRSPTGGPEDLRMLCIELAAWMIYLGRAEESLDDARRLAAKILNDGCALEKFRQIVAAQGGDVRAIDDASRLPQARHRVDVTAAASGYAAAIACEDLGTAAVALGGGREKKDDAIDPAVGLVFHTRLGQRVEKGQPLCTIHYNSEARLAEARRLVEGAVRIADKPPAQQRPQVHRVLGAE